MIDLKNLPAIIQRRPEEKDYPKHVIINLFPVEDNLSAILDLFHEIVEIQIEHNLPILTISLGKDINDQKLLMDFVEKLMVTAKSHKINTTIFGRWYDYSGELVEALKDLNNETNDFDHFFLNLCLNYDSKQEIADACRVIIRKIEQEKIDIDSISPDILKENIYSSNFMPADLIIETSHKLSGTFLWDSPGARIFKIVKPLEDISKTDIIRTIQWYAGLKQ